MASVHSSAEQPVTKPDERAFLRWLTAAARPYLGWLLAVLGAVAIFFCWYGVSGQTVVAKQLPYLASDGLVGIGLLIIAAALIATGDRGTQRMRLSEMQRKVDDLYGLLVLDPESAVPPPSRSAATDAGFVALPTGTSYHRPTCALVAGKPAVAVDAKAIVARSLTPCRVCDPSGAGKSG